MANISAKRLKEKLDDHKVCVLDVRAAEKFALNHITHHNTDMINIPKQRIFDIADNDKPIDLPFSKETEIVITCTTGNSAGKCADILEDKGYQVTVLEGGITAWNNADKT